MKEKKREKRRDREKKKSTICPKRVKRDTDQDHFLLNVLRNSESPKNKQKENKTN